MLETSARLLRLLSLLPAQPDWTGSALAERLGVNARTVRNDVARLRRLGYPVHATRGASGGYRLGAGAVLPPLLLDDDEAVAVAIGLGAAATGTVNGIAEASGRALAKIEQVLPLRLRHRITTLQAAMAPWAASGPAVEPATLTAIAAAVRERQQLRFTYQNHDGATSRRTAEPHWLVHTGHRWYLVAWDVGRAGWRTFRVDRLQPRVPTGPSFTPRDPPHGDVAEYVDWSVHRATMRFRARVLVHAPAAAITPWLPSAVQVSPLDDQTCLITAGSESPHSLALCLGLLDVDFEVTGPELVEQLRCLADRYLRAVTPRPPEPGVERVSATGH